MLKSLIRQPLLHFAAAALLIFVAYDLLSEAEEPDTEASGSGRRIVVDRQSLLDFLQYRAQAFQPELFAARLDAMSPQQRQALVDEYVREEALYREALDMGMERGDYNIKQRLVQKVEFLLENLTSDAPEPDEATLRSWFEERREDYYVDEVYDFTHIFFDAQGEGMDAAAARARALLTERPGLDAEDAERYGDRYPFLQSYRGRTRDFVVNNFNEAFVAELDRLEPDPARWAGPFASRYGQHLVLLRERVPGRVPELDEIRDRVLSDYRYERRMQLREQAEARVISEYEVVSEL